MTDENASASHPTQKTDSHAEAELKLLRDQVDILQIATTEKKKPWYQQVSNIVSVIALISSVFSAIYVQIGKNSEEIRSQKEELRKTIALLIDQREDFQTRVMSIQDSQARERAGSFLNTKRAVLLEAAEFLVTKIPQHVSSSEYNVLAWEAAYSSNFAQAERYFLKAIDASHVTLNRIVTLRSLASFYFGAGPPRDFEKARKYFQQAVEALKSPSDSYSIYTLAFTYEMWGLAELTNGFQSEGNLKIERALKYYSDLPLNDPQRSQSLELLDIRIKQLYTQGKAPESNANTQ